MFLEEIGLREAASVGEEAAALSDLKKAGIPIVSAFVLSVAAYREFLQGREIKQENFRRLISTSSLPQSLAEEIRESYRRLSGPRDTVVDVRTSSTEEEAGSADELVALIRKFWVNHLVGIGERGGDFYKEPLPLLVQQKIQSHASGNLFTSNLELESTDFCLVEIIHPEGKERFVFEKGTGEPVKRTVLGLVEDPTVTDNLRDFSKLAAKIERILGGAYQLRWSALGQEEIIFNQLKKIYLPSPRGTALELWLEVEDGLPQEIGGITGFVTRNTDFALELAERFADRQVLLLVEGPDLDLLARFRDGRHKRRLKNLHLVLPPVRTVDGLTEMKRFLSGEEVRRGPNLKLYLRIFYPSNVVLLEKFIEAGIDGVVFDEEALARGLLGTKEAVEPDESLLWAIEETGRKCRTQKTEFFYRGGAARSWILFELSRVGAKGVMVEEHHRSEYMETLKEAERERLSG